MKVDDEERWDDLGFDEGYWGTHLDPLLKVAVNWSKATARCASASARSTSTARPGR